MAQPGVEDATPLPYALVHYYNHVAEFAARAQRRSANLQLSVGGHLTTIPCSRSVCCALVVLACARLLLALVKALPIRGLAVLLAWAAAEACFFVYQRRRVRVLNRPAPGPACVPDDLVHTYRRGITELGLPLEPLLSGWFRGTPLASLHVGNVQEYFSYILYYKQFSELAREARGQVESLVADVEARLGRTFKQGYDASVSYMGHLWEPLRTTHLPLAAYIATELAGWATDLLLWCCGFSVHSHGGLRYWVKRPGPAPGLGSRLLAASMQRLNELSDSVGSLIDLELDRYANQRQGSGAARRRRRRGPAPQPIVVLHGILGLPFCFTLINYLLDRCPEHPVLLLDIRPVSLRLVRDVLPFDAIADAAAGALRAEGYGGACFVGHSYGTFVISRLRALHPEVVAGMVLLEPVALLPCWPQLLFNFLYAPPRVPRSFRELVLVLRRLVAREPTMAATFCRHFHWNELIMWPQDLPPNTLVVLSMEDDLVPSHMLAPVINARPGCRLLARPGAAHGDVLVCLRYQADIADAVRQLLRDMGAGKAKLGIRV